MRHLAHFFCLFVLVIVGAPAFAEQGQSPASGGGHWQRAAFTVAWPYGAPTSYEGGQGKKLGSPPKSGDRWVGGDSIIHVLETVTGGHEVTSTQEVDRPDTLRHSEASWSEPPAALNPGQTVQLRVSGASCYVYQGNTDNNTNLVHAPTNETATSAPFKVPQAGDVNSDVSKAEFGFFCGASLTYTYSYHWVGGSVAAPTPSPVSTPLVPLAVKVDCQDDRKTSPSEPGVLTHATVSGGQRPYRYQWFDGTRESTATTPNVNWIAKTNAAHTYRVVVTDAAGATAEAACEVAGEHMSVPLAVELRCRDNRLASPPENSVLTSAVVSGGQPPYRYQWFDGTRKVTATKSNVNWIVRPESTHAYHVVVTDSAGATAEANCGASVPHKKGPLHPVPGSALTPCTIPVDFESIFDVAPRSEMAGPLLDAGNYYVYVAPAGKADEWKTWGWKRYGPFDLQGSVRYQFSSAGDLSRREATVDRMTHGQTDVLFLNRSDGRLAFAVRPVSDCEPVPPRPATAVTPCTLPAEFESVFDVAPRSEMAGPLLDAGTYVLFIAAAGKADEWKSWGWKRYGPFELQGGVRYRSSQTGDLSRREVAADEMTPGQADVLFVNRSDVRTAFALRPASDCRTSF